MTRTYEDLTLDSDGIPILTNPLRDNEPTATPADERNLNGENAADIATLLLCSDSFMQQLDDIAEELTYAIREQLESALQPVIESAVSNALNDSAIASTVTIHEQLKDRLPDIIARTLQDELSHK